MATGLTRLRRNWLSINRRNRSVLSGNLAIFDFYGRLLIVLVCIQFIGHYPVGDSICLIGTNASDINNMANLKIIRIHRKKAGS